MASAPYFREPESYESLGSVSLNADCSPPVVPSSCLVADSAAPVFPFNGDDFGEHGSGFQRYDLCPVNEAPGLSDVQHGERHVFLCFKEPQSWPPQVEAAESDRLPRNLAAAIKTRKNEMTKKTRLTICEGRDGTDSSNGDIMIFPDMVRYRGLTHFDVDAFVDEVLVQNQEWISGRPERLFGTHIFVCAHASHDARCGISGPLIIGKFKDEISSRGLGDVFVRPCSHIGGHKYSGNLIIYSSNATSEVKGYCYGYVTPDDVSIVLNEHVGEWKLVDERDAESEQAAQYPIGYCNEAVFSCRNEDWQAEKEINGHPNAEKMFCMNGLQRRRSKGSKSRREEAGTSNCSRRIHSSSRWWHASWWFDPWEREDTVATLAVVGAVASVAISYHLYRIQARH